MVPYLGVRLVIISALINMLGPVVGAFAFTMAINGLGVFVNLAPPLFIAAGFALYAVGFLGLVYAAIQIIHRYFDKPTLTRSVFPTLFILILTAIGLVELFVMMLFGASLIL